MPALASRPHPHLHEPALRAILDAAPPLAELARVTGDRHLLGTLTLACGDLVHGFASPAGSPARRSAHHRAWTAVRQLERGVLAARLGRRAPATVVAKAQRAVDRADVMIGGLPGVAFT